MKHNPERLAWSVLLGAFAIFCLIAVGFPLLVRSYLLNARQPLHAQVNAQRGIVRVERGGNSRVDAASLDDPTPLEVFKSDGIRTGELDEGLVVLQRGDADDRETLVSIVLYDNSELVLADAYAPRFGFGSGPYRGRLKMEGGRARIEVQPSRDARPVIVEVRTDYARIFLNEGSFAIDVTNQQTSATVRRGTASVQVGNQEVALDAEQRAVVSLSGQLDGPLAAERNLIVNGEFDQGLDTAWVVISSSGAGDASVTTANDEEGQSVVHFGHESPQPAEIGLIQTLNRNVRDLASLVIHVKVRVDFHSLPVCGSLGSECPVMLRIDYLDAAGNSRQWVHGFYAIENPSISVPFYCTTCPSPSGGDHSQVPERSWFLYDSPNLMDIQPPELRPVVIQSVHVYASGHSYESMVTDVELLAHE